MPGLNDCYVLAPKRSAQAALSFLNRFVPNREPSFAAEDPSEVLGVSPDFDLHQILDHLERNEEKGYSMYFRNTSADDPHHAALMFQEDGSLFMLLSVDSAQGSEVASDTLSELQKFSGSDFGYWAWEEAPAVNAETFIQRATANA